MLLPRFEDRGLELEIGDRNRMGSGTLTYS